MHRWCPKAYHVASWPRCRRQDACAISSLRRKTWILQQSTCDVQIRFNAYGSESPEPIKSHHFMDSSWLRYQISNDHCITTTIDCVFDHHSLISSPNVFKIEFSWRHDIKLATRLWTSISNTISMSLLPPKKGTLLRRQNCFVFIDFFTKHAYIAGVYWDIMMMASLTAKRPTSTYSDEGHRYSKRGIMLRPYLLSPTACSTLSALPALTWFRDLHIGLPPLYIAP